VDDAPFSKRQSAEVPVVGVVMEGALLVEGVAVTSFPVDGPDATRFLHRWIRGMRWYDALQAVVLGGVTLAGLGLVDVVDLARRLRRPVLAVTRRQPGGPALARALETAGLADRLPMLARIPPAVRVADGLHACFAGTDADDAAAILRTTLRSGKLPEPLRIAHLVGAALVKGTSRGRV
jgi:endonuclease V-like protein UPF0215 family